MASFIKNRLLRRAKAATYKYIAKQHYVYA
jgi:hypothetical protein